MRKHLGACYSGLYTLSFVLCLLAFRSDAGDIDLQPNPLKPNEYRVGEQVHDTAFVDLVGSNGKLSDYASAKAIVIAMSQIDCPVCQKYAPRFIELEKKYAAQGVVFLLVNVGKHTVAELKAAVQAWGMTARYLPDYKNEISKSVDARSSAEVFVLDRTRTLVYRGPIDDQYGLGSTLPQPKNNYLSEALDEVLAGRPVTRRAFSAPGCALDLDPTPEPEVPLTYHRQISRIVQHNCQTCHRPSEAAPFAMLTYEDVKNHASMIKFMVSKNFMPPWFANPQHGKWENDRSLSPRVKDQLLKWIQNGTPEGNVEDAPLPINYPQGWAIGTPDLELSIPAPIAIPAGGIMPYQYVEVKNPLTEPKYIQAVEIKVTRPEVVHHVVVFIGKEGRKREIGVGRYLGIRVPGNAFMIYPKGYASLLKPGEELTFQIHYTPNGIAVEDVTSVGVKFAAAAPTHTVSSAAVGTTEFEIPAHAPNHEVSATQVFKRDTVVFSFMPHMHLRGKAFRFERIKKNGETEILLDVPRYDFNWQLSYRAAKPVLFEAGDSMKCTGWFDNSENNPNNPNPNIAVKYGEQTTEEMMFGFFDFYEPGKH